MRGVNNRKRLAELEAVVFQPRTSTPSYLYKSIKLCPVEDAEGRPPCYYPMRPAGSKFAVLVYDPALGRPEIDYRIVDPAAIIAGGDFRPYWNEAVTPWPKPTQPISIATRNATASSGDSA
jgi:hypothetical protein